MDYASFIERIRSVEKAPSRYFIIDPDVPLSVYFGLDSLGRPTLLIEDIGKTFGAAEIPSTAQIFVQSFSKKEKACLSFSLITPEQRDVFNTLCYDLFEAARKESRAAALLGLLARFAAWQALLKGTRPEIMSIQEQQGLAAELLALQEFAKSRGFEDALDAWVGPFKMDKDFEFYDNWAEVKSCKVSATSVTISSIEQLDSEVDGALLVYHIDRAPENKDEAFSLKEVVEATRAAAPSVPARTMLDSKLRLAKYVDGEPEYEKRRFHVYSRDVYKVSSQFPCLRRAVVVPAITACQYSISLPAIEEFKEIEG